jgi:nucleoside-diphosphate-sugar epimerase
MKILVTGGAGFIGHAVVAKLEKQGHDVCILDNFTNYGIIPEREITALHAERLDRLKTKSVHRVDIRDFHEVSKVFEECLPDVVIHCAAFPRAKVVDMNPMEGCSVLTGGLVNLLRACERWRVRRFVYISSSMVYGDFTLMGYEDMKCTPKGIYGILKLAGEDLTRDHCARAGIDYIILRPSAVYGPLDVEDRVVSKFLIAAMKNKEIVVHGKDERLDFTYVDDCVRGIVRATNSFNSSGRTYNITRGSGRTLLEAAEIAIEVAGKGRIKIVDSNPLFPSRGTLSNIRAGQDFGYHGRVDIEQGFKQYYEWLQHSLYGNSSSVSQS